MKTKHNNDSEKNLPDFRLSIGNRPTTLVLQNEISRLEKQVRLAKKVKAYNAVMMFRSVQAPQGEV